MKILFYTFPEGHLVSDREFDRLKKGFAKSDMELIRWHKSKGDLPDHDLVLVKGFSHTLQDLAAFTKAKIIYYSIGAEFKKGIDLKEANEPIRELYEKADYVIHISEHCLREHHAVFKLANRHETVIIPACEPNLPTKYPSLTSVLDPKQPAKIKLATTCIPRPVKRTDQLEELCKKFGIELVPAWGGVTDFSYYHDCHGYIHISRKEGMPNTVLEALSYGLPCIVTNYGGAKEAVGDAGIVIKNDPEDIMWNPSDIEPVDEILFLDALTQFANGLTYFRSKVRSRVLSELNDKITAERFREVFESLL